MADLMVGGAFLSAFLNVLFDRLATRQVLDFIRKKKIDEKLFGKLKTSLMTVSVLLDDAETKKDTHPSVKQWLEELKDTTYDAEDLLDEIVTLASKPKKSFFNKSKEWLEELKDTTYHAEDLLDEIVTLVSKPKKSLFKRVVDIVDKMEFLASKKEDLGLHKRVGDHNSICGGRITTSLVDPFVYGRDDDKQKIVESVLMEVAVGAPIPVITIVGMGGIGKTTLAKMVYNDEKVREYFDIKAWVCVTQELDVFHITKTVLETITPCRSSDITDLNLLQTKLKEMLTGKKILLVLDDVWSEDYDKWCKVRDPFINNVASGSKIIVTTRNDGVASIMRTPKNPSHSLKHLSDGNGWELFAHHAFETTNGDSYPHLEVIGKQIVEKCKGLPLAIKLLGGVLRNKDDVKVWENVMKSEFWDLPIGQTKILPALRLSYHFLPTHLKPCFAYCSIFPQDYEFEKEKLVLLWMTEGFVIDKTDKSREELGEEYFDELFSRSFFQISRQNFYDDKTYFVMHDLNHDLARDVSGNFCLTLERSKTCQLSEKVRHFSYTQGEYDEYNKFKPILNAKYLRTFLPVGNPNSPMFHSPSIARIHDLLPKMSCIRVLSLSNYSILELPDSICTLIHLRYFDLSNTYVKCLPDKICQLYNLQTLLLSNCYFLIKLPTNFGELVNLRCLDISGTSIDKLPPQMRKLESLQTLSGFIVGEDNCSGLEELNGLRQLKGSLSITGLHNVNKVEDVIEANLKEKMDIEQLSFEWDEGIKVSNNHSIILDKLQPSEELNRLTLINYGGTRLSNWLGDASLFNLKYLKISKCLHCLSLPSLGQLPSLVELHFDKMIALTRLGFEFYGNGKPFQKLRILTFESMSEWEEWSSFGHFENDDFPKLEKLRIQDCPKLCGNSPKLLPSLHDLCIEGCSELTAIIPRDASLRSLKLIGCKSITFENMSGLNSLKSLEINDFESNSFPSGMMENCTNLEKLRIIGCNNLLEFWSKETFKNYKNLEELTIEGSSCDSMTLGLFSNLKKLKIKNCKNLESFLITDEDDENRKSLRYLSIEDCDKLINFSKSGLQTPNLSVLEEVKSFGGLPSNLQTLVIGGCKKLMAKRREWDLHTLSSLHRLEIGDCEEEIETFPEAEWQLPTSITRLEILGLPNLNTIDGSRLPPNLQTLWIWFCPNLKTIDGSRLPNHLQDLRIRNCPKVKFNSELRNAQDLPASLFNLFIENCSLMEKQVQTMNRDLFPHLRTKEQKFEQIVEMKFSTSLDVLCEGYPAEFKANLNHFCSQQFDEKPDYDYLKEIFWKLLYREGSNLTMSMTGIFSAINIFLHLLPTAFL